MFEVAAHRKGLARFVAFLVVIILAGGLVVYAGRNWIEQELVAPAPTIVAETTPDPIDGEEEAFYAYISPKLRVLVAETGLLAELGNARSRNVIEIGVRADRVAGLLDEIDAYLIGRKIPARFVNAVERYQSGAVLLRQGSDDARAAFFRFDWDAVAAGLDLFSLGDERVNEALTSLNNIVELALETGASPVADVPR